MIVLAMMLAAVGASGSYKLVLVVNDHPLVIDYPSSERCEFALRVARTSARQQWEEAQRNQPAGTILTKPGLSATGMCVPG